MSDKQKKYETEWTFSFEGINDRIRNAISATAEEPVEEHFTAPIGDAKSATVVIGGNIGKHTITALEDSENLLEADTRSVTPVTFTVEENEGQKTVKLTVPAKKDKVMGAFKRTLGAFNKDNDLKWDIRLTPNIPLNLKVNGGVSKSEFDLSQLQLTDLNVDSGVGQLDIHLPATAETYNVSVDSGVGETTLYVPLNTSAAIDIDGGVGNTRVVLAAGVAVRIEAESGIGSLNIPSALKPVTKSDKFVSHSGVWESEGFALSDRHVTIKFDGGIGNFTVKQEDVEIV